MATTETLASASLALANCFKSVQNISFDDLPGDPPVNIDWASLLGLINADMSSAAATPSATNPVEVAVTKAWAGTLTGSGGAATLDLTSLTRSTEIGALDLSGLKIQAYGFACPFTNTHDVTIVPGATNGYNFLDDAASKLVVPPAGMVVGFFPENTTAGTGMPDVAVADAEIDFASTMAAFQINCLLFAG